MGKLLKGLMLAGCVLGSVCLTACKGEEAVTYTGEYAYETEYGMYGVKVNVTVKGDVIDKVEIAESDYIRVTPEWEGNTVYYNGEQALLDSFTGKTVSEVKGYSVTKNAEGTPTLVSAEGISVVTGATQSTGRLILAVKNALEKATT